MKINMNVIKQAAVKYGPSILTAFAMIGVGATGYLVHRADIKTVGDVAETVLFEDDADIPVKVTVKRIMRKNWKNYIPAGIVGLCSMACAFGSNHWHLSKEGALTAAALMYKTSSEEFEKALKEEFSEEKVEEVKKKLKETKEDADRPPWEGKCPDKMKIWEPYSKQWFYATKTDLLWIEITANKMLSQKFEVTMNDILKMYGAKPTRECGKIGWSYDDESFCEMSSYYGAGAWIDLIPQYDIDKDGNRYFVMDYGIKPNDISKLNKEGMYH